MTVSEIEQRPNDNGPVEQREHNAQGYRGAAKILGLSRERVPIERDAVDGCLDCSVEDFHKQQQDQWED
jgi:hypothetical protein